MQKQDLSTEVVQPAFTLLAASRFCPSFYYPLTGRSAVQARGFRKAGPELPKSNASQREKHAGHQYRRHLTEYCYRTRSTGKSFLMPLSSQEKQSPRHTRKSRPWDICSRSESGLVRVRGRVIRRRVCPPAGPGTGHSPKHGMQDRAARRTGCAAGAEDRQLPVYD